MPEPEGSRFENPGIEWGSDEPDGPRVLYVLHPSANLAAVPRCEPPQQGSSGMRRGDERCRNEDEDFVLQHVRAEELLAEFVDRRRQCKKQRCPAREET